MATSARSTARTFRRWRYSTWPPAPIWLRREGFAFQHIKPDPSDPEEARREELRALWDFIRVEEEAGVRHTSTSLESRREEMGLPRERLRALIHVARERQVLIEVELPKAEQRGQRKTYLARGLRP